MSTPIIFGLIGFLLSYVFLRNDYYWLLCALVSVSGLSYFWLKKIDSTTFNFFYDSDFLYLKSKHENRRVKIQKIKSIESTSTRIRLLGIPFYLHQMVFINQNSMDEKLKFWIGASDSKLNEFKKLIQTGDTSI
ncbi:MAG: hypothetical protein ABJN95_16650 [Maribacter sp.]|uniref:hypothetical protein n=1 Tax=Maribacter sp. TaxID=1897614 RepID=UPI00329A2A2D